MISLKGNALLSATLLGASALAADHLTQYCPSTDICYQLNIPEQTAKSGSGDIYFQINGSSSYSWIGIGQGSQMAGSNMFIVYTDGDGNITVSPRLGKGHVEPLHDTAAKVSVLEGSGMMNDRLVANIRCSNCASWQGGSMDFSSSQGSWLYAAKTGQPMDSKALDASIEQHSEQGVFNWNFTSAQGGNDINPFLSNDGRAVQGTQEPTAKAPPSASNTLVTAHGTLGSLAFLVFFPVGAIALRVLNFTGSLWVHAAIQIFSYCTFIAAAGLGIYIARIQGQLADAHPIIGMFLLGILFFQPITGWIHHRMYKKKGDRTLFSHVHLWEGRMTIVLGMINGGLGLALAQEGSTNEGYVIAYSVVAGVMGTLYLGFALYSEIVRHRKGLKAELDKHHKPHHSQSNEVIPTEPNEEGYRNSVEEPDKEEEKGYSSGEGAAER